MRRALADALVLDHPDAPWQLPETLPHAADLRRGVAILEQQLQPVDRKHAAWCIGKLASGFNERLTKDEASLRVEVWLEACGDLPADLWSAATVDLLRSWKRDDHYGRVPEPSDFRSAVQDRVARRTLDLQRAKAMLAKANEPEQAPGQGPIRVPENVRLKRILDEQRTRAYAAEDHRLHDMAHTERALAFAERRRMAPWAQQFFDDRVAAAEGRDSVGHHAKMLAARNSPTNRRMAELAKAHRSEPSPAEYRDVAEA